MSGVTGGKPQTVRAGLDRLRTAYIHRPFTLALAVALLVPGVLAILHGDAVSAALSRIGTDYVSRGMGAALLLGGLCVLFGLVRATLIMEGIGLVLLASGTAVYGVGVILGLGLAGMVAGPVSLAVATGCALRVVSLTAVAGVVAQALVPQPDRPGGDRAGDVQDAASAAQRSASGAQDAATDAQEIASEVQRAEADARSPGRSEQGRDEPAR